MGMADYWCDRLDKAEPAVEKIKKRPHPGDAFSHHYDHYYYFLHVFFHVVVLIDQRATIDDLF